MCGRVNSNPSLAYNENFNLLVSKCRGVTPTSVDNRPEGMTSAGVKKYKKENPGSKLKTAVTGDVKPKNYKKKLIIPNNDIMVLPLPKPTND